MITPALASDGPPYLPAYVAFLTGLLGFVGSWIGAHVALVNFKRQRAFDKQLDWYERAVTAIHSMAEKIQIASTSQENNEPAEKLSEQWQDVAMAHRIIDQVGLQAPLYGTEGAESQMKKIARTVQEVADRTEAFDPPKFSEGSKTELLQEITWLGEYLERSARPVLREGRFHLGLERKPFWSRFVKPWRGGRKPQ
jgi:hypothetical protein